MAFFGENNPLIIAHRGLANDCPENTLPAFRAALDAGADILETDVRVSKDGEVIIAHDSSLQRVANRPGRIRDYTALQLANIDVGQGFGFPTLAQLLEALPRAKVNIDLKTPEVVPAFVDTIRQFHATERVLVASFDDKTRCDAVSQLDGVATSASRKHFLPALASLALGRDRYLAKIFAGIDAIQAPPHHRGVPILSPRFISALRRIGKQVHVWTINEPDAMRNFLATGVTGIVTDRADVAAKVFREHETGSVGKN